AHEAFLEEFFAEEGTAVFDHGRADGLGKGITTEQVRRSVVSGMHAARISTSKIPWPAKVTFGDGSLVIGEPPHGPCASIHHSPATSHQTPVSSGSPSGDR